MAEREGVFERWRENLNETSGLQRKARSANDFALPAVVRCPRPFARIFAFCQRDVTQNVTRREQVRELRRLERLIVQANTCAANAFDVLLQSTTHGGCAKALKPSRLAVQNMNRSPSCPWRGKLI
jgi:hypothetical protein